MASRMIELVAAEQRRLRCMGNRNNVGEHHYGERTATQPQRCMAGHTTAKAGVLPGKLLAKSSCRPCDRGQRIELRATQSGRAGVRAACADAAHTACAYLRA